MITVTVVIGWLLLAAAAFALTRNPEQPPYFNRWGAVAGVSIIYFAGCAALASPAHSADFFNADRPEGFAGEGHAANHVHYDGLRNPEGQSCCNGKDCRPTVARFDGMRWWVKVNNVWRDDFSSGKMLSDEWLRSEQARLHQTVQGQWSTEAHVCASIDLAYNPAKTPPTIYCVITGKVWN